MLQPGDVVILDFLMEEALGDQKKRRPGLVVGVSMEGGDTYVRVAYGTSALHSCRAWEFEVGPNDGPTFELTGLKTGTRFRLDKFLSCHGGACVRIGCIPPALRPRMMRAAVAARDAGFL